MALGQYRAALFGTWWYWVSMEWNWLIYDGTRSVEGGTGQYLMVLGQYNSITVLFVIKWYWISFGLFCLYLLNKSEILSGVNIAGQQQTTNKQGKIELFSWCKGPWKAEMSNSNSNRGITSSINKGWLERLRVRCRICRHSSHSSGRLTEKVVLGTMCSEKCF